jgi:hypothetical protein
MEGPMITEAMAKEDPSLGKPWTRIVPKLKYLHLKNVNMSDETGVLVTQLITNNKRIQRLSIELNTINFKYIEEVNQACARNR